MTATSGGWAAPADLCRRISAPGLRPFAVELRSHPQYGNTAGSDLDRPWGRFDTLTLWCEDVRRSMEGFEQVVALQSTVFQLLTCLRIAIKELVDPMVPSAVTTKMEQPQIKPLLGTMSTGKNKSKASKGQVLAIKHYNYVLDARKNLFHKQGCALINYQSKHLKGYDTLKGCLREMAKPCGCCRHEYNECVNNGEQPERWWFYSKKSDRKIIHTAECCMYKRIGRENALYFTSLEQAQAKGYHLLYTCL